ncbi:MAG TPA: sulfite exporter TauE/SafE family protein [Bacteroidota bacterium]|jgi:uncharacterized membrane protein YfcA
MIQALPYILLGLIVGVLAGVLGIGGAVFVVPALVYIFGWEQHMAQGTTLAMLLPPIGLFAAWTYYKAGNVDFKVAALLCVGFLVGGYFGGSFANQVPADSLRKIFGVALLIISLRMIIGK